MRLSLRVFRRVAVCVLAAAVLLPSSPGAAQTDMENIIKQLGSEAVKGYIQPMADLFGANMNAGLFHSAAIPRDGFFMELSFVGMGASVGDDQKLYTLNLPPGFGGLTTRQPTIFGPKATLVTDPATGLQFKGSDGIIDASLFPLVVPQLTVGNFYGTQASLRYVPIPAIGDDKFPKVTLFGIGARHSISQYLEEPPLDAAVGLFYSSFTVGDLIDFSGISIGAQAGKTFSVVDVYGGLAWESSSMNLQYTQSGGGSPVVDIDLDGANSFRFTLGAGLKLAFLRLFADANFGSVTNFSGGIGFGN
ncbi:MAG: DUF6588 family protein [Bacteroidota bacterium]